MAKKEDNNLTSTEKKRKTGRSTSAKSKTTEGSNGKTEKATKEKKVAKPTKEKKAEKAIQSQAIPAPPKRKKKEEQPLDLPLQQENKHFSLLTDFDVYLFKEGRHYHLYRKLGSHVAEHNGVKGTYFAMWAPNAEYVSVIGDFNQWSRNENPMQVRHDGSGIWEIFIPGTGQGTIYKYFIRSHHNGYSVEKGDPYAFRWETPPRTASVVWDLQYKWNDKKWLDKRKKQSEKQTPMSVYEMHIGSWRRKPEEDNRSLTYVELAEQLPAYLKEMGFTHVEFMPVMEHPFFGSWGYQLTGYFAPSSRFGSPQDFMALIDALHKEGIGIILDWVPSHFPTDEHGLGYFDGTHLYEHADPRKGFHPDWQSFIFNYGRNEVRSFLISNALYWLDCYHIDGLRVDAVASMLYLDYSRKEGEWIPNEYGGRENLDAIQFIREFNEAVYNEFPDVQTIAEESTAWPMVSRPTYIGGLGFGMKWMMGWMHDTLSYMENDPVFRQYHHGQITFSLIYAFHENFVLPLSHDEVVHGKGSLIGKMPGDEWQKCANLRLLYSFMYAHPGKKMLFMGGEFGQHSEWNHDSSLDWHILEHPCHQGIQNTLKELNHIYRTEEALYELDFSQEGFEWIDTFDAANSVISFIRKNKKGNKQLVVICNFTPLVRENYRVGVPSDGRWVEFYNSDDEKYWGSNTRNTNALSTEKIEQHGRENSLSLTLPPLGVVYLKKED